MNFKIQIFIQNKWLNLLVNDKQNITLVTMISLYIIYEKWKSKFFNLDQIYSIQKV